MLNQEPNYGYLGHPVNSYHFIRHMAIGWPVIMSYITKIKKHPSIDKRYGMCQIKLCLEIYIS